MPRQNARTQHYFQEADAMEVLQFEKALLDKMHHVSICGAGSFFLYEHLLVALCLHNIQITNGAYEAKGECDAQMDWQNRR